MGRRLLVKVLGCAAVFFCVPSPSGAVPPPAPPQSYLEGVSRIDALSHFAGAWAGEEVQHTARGDYRVRVFRNICRVGDGGGDVMLFFRGREGKVFYVDVVTYNDISGHYIITFPGYRHLTNDDSTLKSTELKFADGGALQWQEPGPLGDTSQITLSESEGVLRETTVNRWPSGQTSVYETTMARKGDAECMPQGAR